MTPHKKRKKAPFKWWRVHLKFIYLQSSHFSLNLHIYWQLIFFQIVIFEWCSCIFSLCRLGEEVGRLFLQASPQAGIRKGSTRVRDSGYDSLHRRLSVLDRLVQTHAVWLQLGLSHHDATLILQNQPAGVSFSTFLYHKTFSWVIQGSVSYGMEKENGWT